ncbi:MAG: hypothetical protein LBD02_04315 [Christensenellaceae bacterium]|nr:hypothetical protein [Christensenellaceae bacterium]
MNPKPFDATLDREGLVRHIREMAGARATGLRACPSAKKLLQSMAKSQAALEEMARAGEELLPGSAWFLENYPYLEEAAEAAQSEGRQKLPAAGRLPRAFLAVTEAVAHQDAHIDAELLSLCAKAYMEVQPLSMAEIWALPRLARLALLRAAEKTAQSLVWQQRRRRGAESYARRSWLPGGAFSGMPAEMMDPAAIERVSELLQGEEELLQRYAELLAEKGLSLRGQIETQQERRALDRLRMAGAVQSLHRLEEMDFVPLFEELYPPEKILRAEESGVYERCEFETREMLRLALARVAKLHRKNEARVARLLLSLSEQGENPARRQIAYYLTENDGLLKLSRALGGARPGFRLWLWMRRHAKGLYFGLLCLLVAALCAALYRFVEPRLALLSLLPAFSFGQRILGGAVGRLFPPRLLCKLDFSKGIPDAHRAAVVTPVLLSSPGRAAECVENLERLYLANPQTGLNFVLLGDFADHGSETREDDSAILQAAMEGMHRLNLRYGERFYFLHRPRKWSLTQRRYIGWERKRGALKQFNQAVLSGDESAFCCVNLPLENLRETRYAITLDGDTILPPGSAARLVGALAHPLNRAKGVLAPRVQFLYGWKQTLFGRVMTENGGVDSYSAAVSETYQDLCGEGIFGGKGIYSIKAFENATAHLPQNAILSHDLLEGLLAGAALLSDVPIFEKQPQSLRAWGARQHRWTRGDWQLLPFLAAHGLSGLGRFKIADNLRRSLSPLSAVLAGMLCGPWGLLVIYLELGLPRSPAWLVRLALLPWQAMMQFGAALKTLWRLLVTRRNLLSWVTAADLGGRREMSAARLLFCPLAGALSLSPLLLPVWALAMFLPFLFERPGFQRRGVDKKDRDFLLQTAKETYAWFETNLSEKSSFLPPDNVQEAHGEKVDHRSSPTNIGLALCAQVAARDLGLISAPEMARRLERTLLSVEKMEKWNGQLYNWYDIRDLRPLAPRYISSVDNGNLGVCLMSCAAALREGGENGLAMRFEKLCREMDFKPLYDEARQLFYIGFDEGAGRMSPGHYDLLASESRLLSFFAIVKGDVPPKHFAALGRPLTGEFRRPTLLSWSGTLFEYLMPLLFLESAPLSLLRGSEEGAVEAQMRAVKMDGGPKRPWGESESGYNAFDLSLNYQYRAFGLPTLSMRGGEFSDVVVSPYSAALALLAAPRAAAKNLRRMKEMGWSDAHGFYEAADYSEGRSGGKEYALVLSHMAHHQGMALLALEAALGGKLRGRFMALPGVQAHALLLAERAPAVAPPKRSRPKRELRPQSAQKVKRAGYTAPRAFASAQLLFGGGTSLLVTGGGVGPSKKAEGSFFRADEDGLCLHFYLDGERLRFGRAFLDVDKARFSAESEKLSCKLEIAVSPEDGAIVFSAQLNLAAPREKVEFGAYFEPVLAERRADETHKAFSDLFLQASAAGPEALRICRRPRGEEQPLGLLFELAGDGEPLGMQSQRVEFIGRGGDLNRPKLALSDEEGLSRTPVEPCAALFRTCKAGDGRSLNFIGRIDLQEGEPGAPASLPMAVERAFELAAIRAQAEISSYNLSPAGLKTAGRALAALASPALCGGERLEHLRLSTLGQEGLWRFGLSGDLPLIVLRIGDLSGLRLAKESYALQNYLGAKGFSTELVVIDEGGADYRQGLRDALGAACPAAKILPGHELSEEERALLCSRAGLLLRAPGPELDRQIPPIPIAKKFAQKAFTLPEFTPIQLEEAELCDRSGYGGFSPGGEKYVVTQRPPMPWSNVLANEEFGSLVTENFGGYSFYQNARLQRLTPFSNDQVLDPAGEGVFLRDEESGQIERFTERVSMLQGAVVGESGRLGLRAELTVWVDREKPLKFMRARVFNGGPQRRRLTLWGFARWVLGADDSAKPSIFTSRRGNMLLAENRYGGGFVGFLTLVGGDIEGFSCDGAELRQAETLEQLSGAEGAGFDPCALLRAKMEIGPGETKELCVVLGAAQSEAAALRLQAMAEPPVSLKRTLAFWEGFLGRVRIKTPDERLNRLCNRWLPYQALAGRLWGRTGFYQSGGAVGFRDQLQDAAMLAYYDTSILRRQILLSAAHQFEEGDVMHWWHPPRRGVRTRISDDLLFLPWAAAQYARMTGETAIFNEEVPFLRGEALPSDKEDFYFQAEEGGSASLMEHCLRAIKKAAQTGPHGLALMGGGDWNDAMNRVGHEGKGESVFVSFMLAWVIRDFLPFAPEGETEWLCRAARGVAAAIEEHAQDGDWYIRAYFDDGSRLGGKGAGECSIDLSSQALAVLSGAVSRERAQAAMDAAVERLYEPSKRLFKLLDPPFEGLGKKAGYISGYLPGVRENGGQYTHAAAWGVLALCLLGDRRAPEILLALLPAGRNEEEYKVEPYVAAADIYAGQNAGRGGWTWYTGAAAWLWRAAVEGVCGLRGGELTPCAPETWEEIEIELHGRSYGWRRTEEGSAMQQGHGEGSVEIE